MNKKSKGVKFDTGKLRWDLLPLSPLREVIKAFMHGAEIYSDWNWKVVVSETNGKQRYYNPALRHLTDYWDEDRDDYDKDSRLHHLAHGICCLLILLWKELKDKND